MPIRKLPAGVPFTLDWADDARDDDDDIPAILQGLTEALPQPSGGRWLGSNLLEDLDHA